MKRAITLRLCVVIILSMLVSAFFSFHILIKSSKEAIYDNSLIRINQIAQIIEQNDQDIVQLKENLKEDYFIRAKAAAYIVQNHSEVIGDLEEMRKIAALLQVDEMHLFDPEGLLFSGTEPKYYNYTFNSGEQMQFFLPMLDDYSMQLCQEVTPNTAEGKLMQYIAVWREDRQGIIQIGMEPIRLLEAMEKNELSHIFSLMTVEKGITVFAADARTGELLGVSDAALMGKNLKDIGLDIGSGQNRDTFTAQINGEKSFCVVQRTGDLIVGVGNLYGNIYENVSGNMVLVIASLFAVSLVIILLILMMLDKFIITKIKDIIKGMKKIAGGDLDYHVEAAELPELVELSDNINSMVKSLLAVTNKLSLVFQNVDVQIAVYEYNPDMKRVLATSKIGEILLMSEEELSEALSDRDVFCEKISSICSRPHGQEKDIYRLEADTTRYVRINSYQEGHSILGVIVDMTEEILEKQEIKLERDIDLLTGIFNRRAFYAEMDRLFLEPEALGTAALLMVDLDGLKYVNDHWGHEYGDRLLSRAADLLKSCTAPHKAAARFGGDEFVLAIYGAASEEEIQGYLDELYTRIIGAFINLPGGETRQVCMSGGYIFYPEFRCDYRELLHLADQAMYRVKNGTKGRFARYRKDD